MLRLSYVEYNQSKARVSRIQLLVAVILEVLSSLILSICSCIDIRPMIFVLLVVIMTFSIPCFERCDYIYTYIYIIRWSNFPPCHCDADWMSTSNLGVGIKAQVFLCNMTGQEHSDSLTAGGSYSIWKAIPEHRHRLTVYFYQCCF